VLPQGEGVLSFWFKRKALSYSICKENIIGNLKTTSGCTPMVYSGTKPFVLTRGTEC